MDNGPELTAKVLDEWAKDKGVDLDFIKPGKPIPNAFWESFIGKFRDKCLNEHWFSSVQEAENKN